MYDNTAQMNVLCTNNIVSVLMVRISEMQIWIPLPVYYLNSNEIKELHWNLKCFLIWNLHS